MAEQDSLGVLMLDIAGLELTPEDRELLSHPQVGGVILGLHGRNYASANQLRDLVSAIRQCNAGLLVAVDQEGGRVQRFRHDFTRLPAMHVFARLLLEDSERSLSLARTCGWLMAAEVLSFGLDLSFAPVLDLYHEKSRIIADRAFSADPAEVVKLASQFMDGMHQAGMSTTGKHFPGHGSVAGDSHVELPVDNRTLEQLLRTDLRPFIECMDKLDALMPGHVVYPQVDASCAALSKTWLQSVLRGQLGFSGVIFSDDLSMAAAASAGDVLQRADQALQAGCDMILVCNDRPQARAVVDWLDATAFAGSLRLAQMRATPSFNADSLSDSAAWQAAREQINALIGQGD